MRTNLQSVDYTGYNMKMPITPENCFILQVIRKTNVTIALVFIKIPFRKKSVR